MNLALANTVGGSSTAFVTARGAYDKVSGLETRTPGEEDPTSDRSSEPLTGRYPIVAFSYNSEASRLIMLFRDPASGEAIKQIPSETVVKQYEEAQVESRKAARRGDFEVVIGGGEPGTLGVGRSQGSSYSILGGTSAASGSGTPGVSVGGGVVVGAGSTPAFRGGSSGFGGFSRVSVGGSGASAGGSTSVNVVI